MYQSQGKNSQITTISQALGLDQSKLVKLMNAGVTATTINAFGRFDDLKNTVDQAKARAYFENRDGGAIPTFKVKIKVDQLLEAFILRGGFDLG